MPEALAGQIQLAVYLVNLGKVTYDEIRGFFSSQGHDEEALAGIMLEVDQRIARRG